METKTVTIENAHINKNLVGLVGDILKDGWRVFIAESGNYGFFTNDGGERAVDFQLDLGVVSWSGNYKTNQPKATGGGWRIEPDSYKNMFRAIPPRWAVGDATWKYSTLEMKLAVFQKTSRYIEVTAE